MPVTGCTVKIGCVIGTLQVGKACPSHTFPLSCFRHEIFERCLDTNVFEFWTFWTWVVPLMLESCFSCKICVFCWDVNRAIARFVDVLWVRMWSRHTLSLISRRPLSRQACLLFKFIVRMADGNHFILSDGPRDGQTSARTPPSVTRQCPNWEALFRCHRSLMPDTISLAIVKKTVSKACISGFIQTLHLSE